MKAVPVAGTMSRPIDSEALPKEVEEQRWELPVEIGLRCGASHAFGLAMACVRTIGATDTLLAHEQEWD